MSASKSILLIIIFFSILFIKNNVVSFYWPIFAQLTFLPFLVWSVSASERRWYGALFYCLFTGILMDVFSLSLFGVHILISTALFILAQAWISFFSLATESVLAFIFSAPGIEIAVIGLIQMQVGTIRLSGFSLFGLFVLSVIFNSILIFIWSFYFPGEELKDVE